MQDPGNLPTAKDIQRIFAPDGYMAVKELGQRMGRRLAKQGITRSQMRNILSAFQAIAETWEATAVNERGRQIMKLQPNLAYLAGRESDRSDKGRALRELEKDLGAGIETVLAAGEDTDEMRRRFIALVDLVEAMTAYHTLESRSG